jgi:hypothetical protein
VKGAAEGKQLTWYHICIVGFDMFPEHIRLGRAVDSVLAGFVDTVGVSSDPDCAVKMLPICHLEVRSIDATPREVSVIAQRVVPLTH